MFLYIAANTADTNLDSSLAGTVQSTDVKLLFQTILLNLDFVHVLFGSVEEHILVLNNRFCLVLSGCQGI